MKLEISLSAVPLSLYKKTMKKIEVSKKYDAIFNTYGEGKRANKDRIYIPLSAATLKAHKVEAPDAIHNYLNSLNMRLDDYFAGTAILPDGKRTIRLGKVLSKKPELLKVFENDPQRKAANMVKGWVVISRHPYDIMGMSFDRGWTSCMNLEDGSNRSYLTKDIKAGTIVAYVVKDNDKNINSPIARIAIKPYVNKTHSILVPSQMYGSAGDEFTNIVNRFCHFANSHAPSGIYNLANGLYNDDAQSRIYHTNEDFDASKLRAADIVALVNSPVFNLSSVDALIATNSVKTLKALVEYKLHDLTDAQQIAIAKVSMGLRYSITLNEGARTPVLEYIVDNDKSIDTLSSLASLTNSPKLLEKLSTHANAYVRTSVAKNGSTPAQLLEKMIYDKVLSIKHAVLRNRNISMEIISGFLDRVEAKEESEDILSSIVRNKKTPAELLERIANLTQDEETLIGLTFNDKSNAATLRKLADSNSEEVLSNLAENENIPQDVIEKLSHSSKTGILSALLRQEILSTEVLLRIATQWQAKYVLENLLERSKLPNEVIDYLLSLENRPITESLLERKLTEEQYDKVIALNMPGYNITMAQAERITDAALSRLAKVCNGNSLLYIVNNYACKEQALLAVIERLKDPELKAHGSRIVRDVVTNFNFIADVRKALEEAMPMMKKSWREAAEEELEYLDEN